MRKYLHKPASSWVLNLSGLWGDDGLGVKALVTVNRAASISSIQSTSLFCQIPNTKNEGYVKAFCAFVAFVADYPKPIYLLGWCQLLDHSNRRKHRRNFHESHLVGAVFLWQPSVLPGSKAWILSLLPGQTQMGWAKEAHPGDGGIGGKSMKMGRSRD